jgi:hypothetical protein
MMFGPLSLGMKPDAKPNSVKYAVVEATDHSIALASIFVRFLQFFSSFGTYKK